MAAETFEGVIERVTYYNEETSYSVLRVRPSQPRPGFVARDGTATVVGSMPPLQPGEAVRFTGTWVNHTDYGKQFKAETVHQIVPATIEGLRRYLGSGLIRGIGPTTAQKIIDHFGMQAIDILDHSPDRIREVPGIGPYRADQIAEAWAEQFRIKEIMMFLQGHGISASQAVKIYKEYGDSAIIKVKADPYQLARDITGIGFKTADRIARALGLAVDAPERVRAGVFFALETLTNDGHVYVPRAILGDKVIDLLELPQAVTIDPGELFEDEDGAYVEDSEPAPPPADTRGLIDEAIDELDHSDGIKLQRVPDADKNPIEAVYLRPMLFAEVGTARRLREMTGSAATRLFKARTMAWTKFFSLLATNDRINLTSQQQDSVQAALTHKLTVLTGGPGTGKTTTLRAVIRALEWAKATYALASPTGRAAKRLSEATGRPASTIHRLLNFIPGEGFTFDENEPLDVDMLIIDEASMIDQILFYNVLKALSPDTHLMLVGDVDQLPSVGPGDVLRDLIRSELPHVTRLDTIFRQAGTSQIIFNAHRINNGQLPMLDNQSEDFFWFSGDDPELVSELVVDIVRNRIPSKFGLNPLDDVQVLAPMYRGAIGIQVLNEKLQAALNPAGRAAEKKIGGYIFRVGDKVMQTRNNYDNDVYNGDIGRVRGLDFTRQIMQVLMNDRVIEYSWLDAEELVPAFAVSVHKSQGSEYPAIVLPLMPQHYMMLQRNLLYTAVTRARQLVVLVGMRKAVAMAVKNDKVTQRYTALAWRLAGGK